MAKTIIRQFKRDLPYARLYLDDVEEIVSIFRSAFAAVDLGLTEIAPDQTCEFYFEIEDNVRLDNFEDLKQHGGHVSEFSIWMTYSYMLSASNTRSDQTQILRISYGQPEFAYPRVMEESRWELRAKLLTIFESRRDSWKIFSDSVPWWITAPSPLAIGVVAEVLRRTPKVMIAFSASCLALYGAGLAGVFRRSRVYLYYRRADQQERQKSRQQTQTAIVAAILGAILGSAMTVVGEWVLKRYSH